MDTDKQYYEITDAFLALKDIDDEAVEGMLRNDRKVREGKAFSIQSGSRDLEAARKFIDEENEADEEIEVIDVDADVADHLKKNTEYVGQAILCCNRCKANRFMDMDLLVASEADEDVYNVEDECPHCHDAGAGYSLIGQVGKVEKEQPEEEPEAEIENDEKAEDEATFENDVEEEPEAEEEESTEEEPTEEEPEIDTFEEEPESDGMETDTSEDELDDLDLPKLGDEVDQDETEEDEDNVKESLNEDVQLNKLAEEAWMMNRVISAMNDEDAYYGSWLNVWPDGESREACAYDFGDQESFDELEDLFFEVYKYYHADGLYDAAPEVVEYAHMIDSKLGLSKIENIEAEKEVVRESYDCVVAGDVFKAIANPENIDKIIILDVSDEKEEPRTIFKGTKEDLPMNVVGSPCSSFDVADGYLSCNVDTEIRNTNRPLSKALQCFNDDKTEKVLIWDQATGDEVFSGTKADACDKFGDCEFISFETPAVVRICINNPSILSHDEIEGEEVETDVDKLIKKIIDANNLSQYKTDKPNTNEYWIKNCIEQEDDLELIYESFVKPSENKELIAEFKAITGYNNPIEEAYEAGFAAAHKGREEVVEDVTLDQVKAEVEKAEDTQEDQEVQEKQEEVAEEKPAEAKAKKESVQSFKSRKELAEAVSECKNNSRPYTIRRSVKEGFRYDLITEEVDAEGALVPTEVEDEVAADVAQTLPVEYSRQELAVMNNIHRIAQDIAESIKRYYDIDADPSLIVADILQDLNLISGQITADELSDTLANNITKEMFKSYEDFYAAVDEMLSEVTGKTIHTTPEQKLAHALQTLEGPEFSQQNIDQTIGSTRFVDAIKGGCIPYIAAADLPMIEEALKRRSCQEECEDSKCDEACEDGVCEKCGKSPCECVESEISEGTLLDKMKALAGIKDDAPIEESKCPEECSEEDDENTIDVDTDAFDAEMNEYFNEAYEDTVLYTTTDGHIEDDGTIILEGLVQLDEVMKPVAFTLTPETRITEAVEDKKAALTESLKQTFTVTNNISEEKFEFKFNN